MSSVKLEFYCDVENQTVKPSKRTLELINCIDESIAYKVFILDMFGDLSAFLDQLYDSFLAVDPNDEEAVKNHKSKEQILEKWKTVS